MATTTTATAVAGTDGASLPFWSPDQRHVGFFADRKLKVVEIGSGALQVLADAPRASGGTWGTSDVIVFAPDVNGPLYRVTAAGGTPAPPVACQTAKARTATDGPSFSRTAAIFSISP